MPQLPVGPCDTCYVAIALKGTKNRATGGIHLINFAVLVRPYPQRAFGPCQAGYLIRRRRNTVDYSTGSRINFLDAIVRDLKQMLAVESGSCVRYNVD